jgi:hypothetical protein
MNLQPLSFLVPVAAIIGYFIYLAVNAKYKAKENIARVSDERMRQLTEESVQLNRQLLDRLDKLENKVSRIERTLEEIPS